MAVGALEDVVIPLIVFIVIIVQMIRAAKKFSESRPGKGGDTETKPYSLSPEEQLRNFLEGLAKPQGETAEPQPAPPVKQAGPVTPPPPATIFRPEVPAPSRGEMESAPPVVPAVALSAAAVDSRQPQRVLHVQRAQPGTSILDKLAHRRSLKEAIMLREILGPPMALRRQWWGSLANDS